MSERTANDVTVIVVAYNHEDFVAETLSGIAEQEHIARVILCDDASPDGSADVMRSWARGTSIPTTEMLAVTNRGLTATLNEALAQVDTPYYTYISGDDLMFPGRIAAQRAYLEARPDLVFVYCDARRFDEYGNRLEPDFLHVDVGDREPVDDFDSLLRGNWIPAVSVMLRTDAVRSAGGYDANLFFEDYDLWLRLAASGPFARVDGALVGFRELSTSLGHTRFHDDDLEWQWAKVRIRQKHFGRDRRHDRLIASIIRPWLITIAQRGGSTKELVPIWWRVALAERTLLNFGYAVSATLRLIGPVTRLRGKTRIKLS